MMEKEKDAKAGADMPQSRGGMAMDACDRICLLYNKVYGVRQSPLRLEGSGSSRRYYRFGECLVSSGDGRELHVPPVIGVAGEDKAECRSFMMLSRVFREAGCNVPLIYGGEPDAGCCLQEDLGDVSLYSLLATEEGRGLALAAMENLPRMQRVAYDKWKDAVYMPPFGKRQAMWDLNYFKYEYLRPSGEVFDENLLEDDFDRLVSRLSGIEGGSVGFMYRDCQSRNVMVREGEPWWIDYQGGRRGPCLYDAVSFIWQAKAPFGEDFRLSLLDRYVASYCKVVDIDEREFLAPLPDLRLFRALQVLGAYGLRGLVERKSHFLTSIPGALRNLERLTEEDALKPYPELGRICGHLVEDRRFRGVDSPGLTVSVFSFSYKKGYPDDFSGNGGGFMFDCRGMHNPGRYPEYKSKTGRDPEVIRFLEERGEVQDFMENVYGLVDRSVSRYAQRGFSSLQVGFGCTGGQHRSVYCAEAMARHLGERFPDVRVKLCHRER